MFKRKIINTKYVITYRYNWYSDNWSDMQTDNLMSSYENNLPIKILFINKYMDNN